MRHRGLQSADLAVVLRPVLDALTGAIAANALVAERTNRPKKRKLKLPKYLTGSTRDMADFLDDFRIAVEGGTMQEQVRLLKFHVQDDPTRDRITQLEKENVADFDTFCLTLIYATTGNNPGPVYRQQYDNELGNGYV
jgi:hypothetical protein